MARSPTPPAGTRARRPASFAPEARRAARALDGAVCRVPLTFRGAIPRSDASDVRFGCLFRTPAPSPVWPHPAERGERVATAVHHCRQEQEAAGRWTAVRSLAQAYLHRDPLDETVVAAAMRADAASGSASAAHRRFQVLEAALAREFGVAPGAAARD